MKRFTAIALMLAVLGSAVVASAATEVKMTGDARVWANYFTQQNYTGWNPKGTQTADPFVIWERFRLRTDFIANEGLKFRLGIRVNNKAWGNNTMTIDNPAVSIDVYMAYLQFKWPGTNIEFTAGLAPIDLPLSSPIFNGNPVLGGGAPAAQFTINAPVNDNFAVVAGFTRLLDGNDANGPLFQATTTSKVDTFDAFFLTLPITVDGFKAVPWAVLGLAGRDANYSLGTGTSPKPDNRTFANNLFSAGTYAAPTGFKNSTNAYWWVGSSFTVTALDPFKFYADVMYGEGNSNDRGKDKRAGWFFDVAAEYTGLDMVTPQIAFWYGSGEDSSTRNGSERMPTVTGYWGAAHSFVFDSGQAFGNGYLATNPMGSYGVVVALDKISFVQDLTHRITFTFAQGNNSARALRQANLLTGGAGNYVQMGRDLSQNESVIGVGFDNQYNIYENLAAIVETGWAHGNFEASTWGHRMTHQANNGDVWKVAFGLQYKF